MQDFIARENVRHLRLKLSQAKSDSERARIAALLEEARAELFRRTGLSDEG